MSFSVCLQKEPLNGQVSRHTSLFWNTRRHPFSRIRIPNFLQTPRQFQNPSKCTSFQNVYLGRCKYGGGGRWRSNGEILHGLFRENVRKISSAHKIAEHNSSSVPCTYKTASKSFRERSTKAVLTKHLGRDCKRSTVLLLNKLTLTAKVVSSNIWQRTLKVVFTNWNWYFEAVADRTKGTKKSLE